MKTISKDQLSKGIVTIFNANQRTLRKLGDFPSHMYLRCLIVIALRTAVALCSGDKSKAITMLSQIVNESVLDDAHR